MNLRMWAYTVRSRLVPSLRLFHALSYSGFHISDIRLHRGDDSSKKIDYFDNCWKSGDCAMGHYNK